MYLLLPKILYKCTHFQGKVLYLLQQAFQKSQTTRDFFPQMTASFPFLSYNMKNLQRVTSFQQGNACYLTNFMWYFHGFEAVPGGNLGTYNFVKLWFREACVLHKGAS